MTASNCDVAVLVPVFGNAATLEELARRVAVTMESAALTYRLLFIVDASPDDSWAVVERLARSDVRVCGLQLSRNVGQHRALLEGFKQLSAPWTAVMDADLQDPPELLPDLIAECSRARVTVYGRRKNRYQRLARMLTSRMYKALLGLFLGLPADVGLCFAAPTHVAESIRNASVRHVNLVVLARVFSSGWRAVPYHRHLRAEGESAYTSRARLRSAVTGLLCVLECHLPRWLGSLLNGATSIEARVVGRVNL